MIISSYLKKLSITIPLIIGLVLPTSLAKADGSEVPSIRQPATPTKWKYVSFKMGPSIKYWTKVALPKTGKMVVTGEVDLA